MINVIFLGAPGSGKGTQAALIAQELDFIKISTGDELRAHVKSLTELGQKAISFMDKGLLVPDELVVSIIKEKYSTKTAKGYIFDGFPRNIKQAHLLSDLFSKLSTNLHLVVELNATDEDIVRRLTQRVVCPNCGATYNLLSNPPRESDICDNCGITGLQHRNDDNIETVKNRLSIYHEQTEPLIEFYKKLGIFQKIDAGLEISKVTDLLIKTIHSVYKFETARL